VINAARDVIENDIDRRALLDGLEAIREDPQGSVPGAMLSAKISGDRCFRACAQD